MRYEDDINVENETLSQSESRPSIIIKRVPPEAIQIALQRTKSQPPRIFLEFGVHWASHLSVLTGEFWRSRSLHLETHQDRLQNSPLSPISDATDFPNLRSARIWISGHGPSTSVVDLTNAPNLNTLTLSAFQASFRLPSTSSLSRLCIMEGLDEEFDLGILNSCPHLEVLHLAGSSGSDSCKSELVVCLPNLYVLSLTGPTVGFLPSFKCPDLEHISVLPHTNDPSAVSSVSSKQFPRLSSLRIRLLDRSDNATLDKLLDHQGLEELVLVDTSNSSLMGKLFSGKGLNSFPHLRVIWIEVMLDTCPLSVFSLLSSYLIHRKSLDLPDKDRVSVRIWSLSSMFDKSLTEQRLEGCGIRGQVDICSSPPPWLSKTLDWTIDQEAWF